MKANQLFLMLIVLIEFSCTTKQEDHAIENKLKQDILVPVQVTVINNLPDSLQPKTVFLDNMPAPRVVASNSGGVTKMQPVLQNENGETILDAEGKPYTMGDRGKSNFTNFTTDNGLALDAVTCSLLDKFGNLWFGTYGGGVSRYDGKSFSTFTTAEGLAHNFVWSITEDNTENLWFGTGGGVSRYDGQSFSTFTTAQGLAHNIVLSITEDNTGNLWFGTNGGGVSRYDGKSFSTFTTAQGLAHNIVRSITKDNTGNLWFGTEGGGVSRYDGKSFSTFTTAQGLAHNIVWSIT
jgi:ligand-binding sensor domain-containing protein